MTAKRSFRVYFVPHGHGESRVVHGTMIRSWDGMFEGAPPSAIGKTESDVLDLLEARLLTGVATGEESLERYLWSEPFSVREVKVEVQLLSSVKKRPVIGSKSVDLTVSYAHCPMPGGGYRVMVPRFNGWFIVEDHALAPTILRHAISSWMLGESPKTLYDFRYEGAEWVLAWAPPLLDRLPEGPKEDDDAVEFPTLTRIGEDWVAVAKRGKLPLPIGESAELDGLARRLDRAVVPSLLLVGPSAVGKTALVRRIGRYLADKKRAPGERARRLWATSADRILAGMVYLGMWQERCIEIVKELEGEGDYLYVGRLLPVLQAQSDGSSIAEMLEPALLANQISMIAECTPAELERAERMAPGFVGHFHIVRVGEPSVASTMEILRIYAERKGCPPLHPAALKELVQLLGTFTRSLAFPGKAIRFIDWLAQERPAKESAPSDAPVLLPRDVAGHFSKYTGIPVDVISDDMGMTVTSVASRLGQRVVGQERACQACARVVVRFKANLCDPDKPLGSLFFVGPTGVGKTELAKQLANLLFGDEQRLVRLDMSEYQTFGSAARLIDASPGVTSLARAIAEQPLAVVLFDEIEKAHPTVFDVLLGILGEGRLTDSAGRFVDFRSTILVMTSNLGARDGAPVGFGESRGPDFTRAVRDHFRPELMGRIDDLVPFDPLSLEQVEIIVRMSFRMLADRKGLSRRGIRLAPTEHAIQRLAQAGYHPTRGARALKRVIEEKVVVPLAAFLAGQPSAMDVLVSVVGEGEQPPGKGWSIAV